MPSLNALALLAAASASVLVVAPACSQDAAGVLAANRTASGGSASPRGATVELDFAYSGQGLTGKAVTVFDRRTGAFTDDSIIGPIAQADAFDGSTYWVKDASGMVTPTSGGDIRQLQVNEAYRKANRWWRADAGGAKIAFEGVKSEAGVSFDVLTVTPPAARPSRPGSTPPRICWTARSSVTASSPPSPATATTVPRRGC